MSNSDEFDDLNGKNEIKVKSDININDSFGEEDYFNDNNEDYKNAQYSPSIDPPKEISFSTRKQNDYLQLRAGNETFMNLKEKFQKNKK